MARERKSLQSHTRMRLHQIVRLEAMDKKPEEIAASLGITVGSLAELTRHPEYEKVREKYLNKLYGPIDNQIAERKANVILDENAADAAEVLADLLYSQDEVTQRLAATAVLDRTGHGPIQRKAARVRHEIDPVTAQLLRDAMLEADGVKRKGNGSDGVIDVEVKE